MWIIKTNWIVVEIWLPQTFASRKERTEKTSCAASPTSITSGRPYIIRTDRCGHKEAMYFHFINFTDLFVIYYALPAEWIVPFSSVVGGENHRILEELVAREINVLNDVIVSHKLGHCDLFSYKYLINVLYNSHDQFYIFLYFVVPNNSIFAWN